ncbi:Ligand-gated ion channel 50 [Dirofilaria immitis]|nr:Ligand-gated ion channel 50 [Dirofilaria immitis]
MCSLLISVESLNLNQKEHNNDDIIDLQNGLENLEKYHWEIYTQNNRLLAELRDNFRKLQRAFSKHENMPEFFEIIDDSITKKYKTYKTPSEDGVTVWIEVWVQEVNSVNEITSDFDMDIYVTELWVDKALKYYDMNPCKFNLSLGNESTGKGPCQMDFTSFPMDEQTCLLTFQSFSYNNQTYPAGVWNELTMTFTFTRRYGWYIFQAYVPTYLTIFISWISFCLSAKMIPARTMLGVNSLLALTFHFGNIMRNLPRVSYIKAFDVWMLSCLSFVFCSLLELAVVGSINARNEATATKQLPKKRSQSFPIYANRKYSPIMYHKEINDNNPAGSISPIDPWMKAKVFTSPETREITRSIIGRNVTSANRPSVKEVLLNSKDIPTSRNRLRKAYLSIQQYTSSWTADRIDRISIILFPSLFTIFNIIYWGYYLSRSR